MSKKWEQLIADRGGPYVFDLDDPKGALVAGKPPYPDLVLEQGVVSEVERLVYHTIKVKAFADHTDREEHYFIGRLVAVLKSGTQVEFGREVLAEGALKDGIDASRCEACGMKIPGGEAEIVEGAAYHSACIE